jgi:ABC-type enterochelin transport system substrate-binding protein
LKRRHEQEVTKLKKDSELLTVQHESNEASLRKRNQDVVNDLNEQLDRLNKLKSKWAMPVTSLRLVYSYTKPLRRVGLALWVVRSEEFFVIFFLTAALVILVRVCVFVYQQGNKLRWTLAFKESRIHIVGMIGSIWPMQVGKRKTTNGIRNRQHQCPTGYSEQS